VPDKGCFDLLDAYAKLEGELAARRGLVFCRRWRFRQELEQRAKRIAPERFVFQDSRSAKNLAGLLCASRSTGSADAQRHLGSGGERSDGVRASDHREQCGGMRGRSGRGWMNGYVVPPENSEKLSVAIDSLGGNLIRQRDERAQSRTNRSYSPEACADGLAVATAGGKGVP